MTVPRFDITDPAFRSDPYPTYDDLRTNDPVHYRTERDDWVLTRHADVLTVLRHDHFGHPPMPPPPGPSSGGPRPIGLGAGAFRSAHARQRARHIQLQWMLFHDPPKHTVLRSLFQDSFSPPQAERWRETIEALADQLVASVAGREQVDVIVDLAYPLPAMVIAEVFGLPRRDWASFREWTRALIPALDQHAGTMDGDAAQRAILGFTEYFEDLIGQRRRESRSDLFDTVLQAAGRVGISDDELISNVALVFLAGQENVQHMIGNGLMALWDHPDQLQRLKDDPQLLGSAVEELARFDTSVQLTSRLALADVEIGGERSARARRSCCRSAPPTATRRSSPTPPFSTSAAHRTPTSPSPVVPTTAWGRPWPGWKGGRCSGRSSAATPTSAPPGPGRSASSTSSSGGTRPCLRSWSRRPRRSSPAEKGAQARRSDSARAARIRYHDANPCSHHSSGATRHSSGQRQTPSATHSARVSSSGGAHPVLTSNHSWARATASAVGVVTPRS